MKKALVRNGHHMRPMLAVLNRYGIGEVDTYGRGKWIADTQLPMILACMMQDPSLIKIGAGADDVCVNGTNMHNHVLFTDFKEMF